MRCSSLFLAVAVLAATPEAGEDQVMGTTHSWHVRITRSDLHKASKLLHDYRGPGDKLPDPHYQPKGNAHWLAPDGDDAASGSREAPWASISTAASRLKPGDTLLVRGGHSVFADPRCVAPGKLDFRLRPTSPCIDKGKDVGLPFAGAAPDIGLFESGGAMDQAKAKWNDCPPIHLKGVDVTLSRPVPVGRAKGHFWFPKIIALSNGELVALASGYADEHRATTTGFISWSGDGGLTWSTPAEYQHVGFEHLRLPRGDELLLPYYLNPRPDGMGAPCNLILAGKRELKLVEPGVTVTGWPRKDKSFAPQLGLSGFVFNGQTVTLKDGNCLATLYGHFEGAKRYSLVAAESKDGFRLDGTGKDWQRVDLVPHHNQCHPKEPIAEPLGSRTTAYTKIIALDDTHLLYIYDRIPNGWSPVPKEMNDTNSVWVVRITVGRTRDP